MIITLMRVVEIDQSNEKLLLDTISPSVEDNYFFFLDFHHSRSQSRFFLAVTDKKSVKGLMLIFLEKIVQLRGSLESAPLLLSKVFSPPLEIQALPEHKEAVTAHFPKYSKCIQIFRLVYYRSPSTEKPENTKEDQQDAPTKYRPTLLNPSHHTAIATVMSTADPVFWGDTTGEIIAKDPTKIWLGIFDQLQLMAVTGLHSDEWGGCIAIVATLPTFQNKGMATTLVSAALKIILAQAPFSVIHVRAENAPALHTYYKCGFKFFKEYLLFKYPKKE